MDDQLSRFRQSIDNIDAALVYMLAERFKVTKAVGELKAREGLPPADPGREERQIERLRDLARDADLDPDFTEKFRDAPDLRQMARRAPRPAPAFLGPNAQWREGRDHARGNRPSL